MKEKLQQLFDNLSKSGGELRHAEPLSRWTSWRVGGPADLFYRPSDRRQLLDALEQAEQLQIPWSVFGAGSNLLVKDGGIRGLVIQTGLLRQFEITASGRVTAACGLWLPRLVQACVDAGFAGIEALAGIPGTLGGALVSNAGAHGQSIGDVLRGIDLYVSGAVEHWPAARVGCRYRASNLQAGQLVLAAELQLRPADRDSLRGRVAELLAARRSRQAVKGANAGSVFKNPPGGAAWKLVDAAGMRGEQIGQAQVAPEHANFIVNLGGATAGDILALIDRVRDRVRTCCGVELETEIRVVGEEPGA